MARLFVPGGTFFQASAGATFWPTQLGLLAMFPACRVSSRLLSANCGDQKVNAMSCTGILSGEAHAARPRVASDASGAGLQARSWDVSCWSQSGSFIARRWSQRHSLTGDVASPDNERYDPAPETDSDTPD
jgi:hypothetical protein